MLVEKYIPKGTQGYQSLSRFFNSFDKLFSFSPLRWFGVWAILIAGDNVVSHLNDRWMYWSWNSLSIYLIIALIFFPYFDYLLNSKYELISFDLISSLSLFIKSILLITKKESLLKFLKYFKTLISKLLKLLEPSTIK